jgi:hypothetical protein
MNNLPCKHCSTPVPQPSTGRPRHFCDASCRVAHNRAHKNPAAPNLTAKLSQLSTKLAEQTAKQAVTASTSVIPPNILPYMPTQNDANIAAIIARGADSSLPFQDHNAIPLCSLPGPIPPLPPIKEITPTF